MTHPFPTRRVPDLCSAGVSAQTATAGSRWALNWSAMNLACDTETQNPSARIESGFGTTSPTFEMISPARTWSPVNRLLIKSEEHTSELQSLMRTSYAVFCLTKKTRQKQSKD